jgi:hypothetical protein
MCHHANDTNSAPTNSAPTNSTPTNFALELITWCVKHPLPELHDILPNSLIALSKADTCNWEHLTDAKSKKPYAILRACVKLPNAQN